MFTGSRSPHRDWMLIDGPGFVEGPIFVATFGIFDNFTVARGMPNRSLVYLIET